MRHFLLILLAAAGLALAASPALAAGQQSAAGSFTEGDVTILSEREVGGHLFIHLTRDAFFEGTYEGVGHADQRIVIHPDGTFHLVMSIDFEGKACGRSTRLTFLVVARGSFVENEIEGLYTALGRVGRGSGRFEGVPDVGGTYSGRVNC
jgi:hypothetical protein